MPGNVEHSNIPLSPSEGELSRSAQRYLDQEAADRDFETGFASARETAELEVKQSGQKPAKEMTYDDKQAARIESMRRQTRMKERQEGA